MNRLLLTVIADGAPHHNGPDFGKASPLGLLVVVLPVVSWMTAAPLAWPESRKAGLAMKVSRAVVPSGTEASKEASSEERLL